MNNLPALWLIFCCVAMIFVLGWSGAFAIMVLAAAIFGILWAKWRWFDKDADGSG